MKICVQLTKCVKSGSMKVCLQMHVCIICSVEYAFSLPQSRWNTCYACHGAFSNNMFLSRFSSAVVSASSHRKWVDRFGRSKNTIADTWSNCRVILFSSI